MSANKPRRSPPVLEKIAEMPKSDRAMAKRVHAIVKASAPDLSPRTWYGMPAYTKDDKVVCFFKSSGEVRDPRLQRQGEPRRGSDVATTFALKELTATEEARIGALVKKAVS